MAQAVETMTDRAEYQAASDVKTDGLRTLVHKLNNQLGIILAHAELLEAKSPDDRHRERATQVVTAAIQAMSLAREIRTTLSEPD